MRISQGSMAPSSAGHKMRALVVTKLGDPTQPLSAEGPLTLSSKQPTPLIVPNGVRIRVTAAALNFADALQIQASVDRCGASATEL